MEALVGEEAAGEAEADREDGVGAEVPVGEDQADPDRDHRLEDHRAGDVAEGEGVLAFADPEEAVDLLRQLGRQRRQDQGQDERLDADAVGDLQQLFDEEVGAADHRPEADQELDHAERQGRVFAALGAALEDQRVERLLLLHLAAAAQGAADVEDVGEEEADPDRRSGPAPADPRRAARRGRRRRGRRRGRAPASARARRAATPCARARGRGRRRGRPGPSPGSPAGTARRRSPRSRRLRSPLRRSSSATIAISVSGVAVPTAARTLPTAPSPSPNPWPSHSTALVNSSAPESTIAKLSRRSIPPRARAAESGGPSSSPQAGIRVRRSRRRARRRGRRPAAARPRTRSTRRPG